MVARLLVLFVVSCTVLLPARPARASTVDVQLCSVEEWRADPARCLGDLHDVAAARAACLKAPTLDTPDSGLGGWFATRPEAEGRSGVAGPYTISGYAGYAYTTYDIGCAQTLLHPDYKFENTVANGEFLAATAIIGASNALRERAWDPGMMWGWADPLVQEATQSLYHRVFTVFGALALAVVGVYLLWRSRQAQLSAAVTTAGWALLVMVVVTALAAWPSRAAAMADRTLVASLDAIHDAVGPPPHSIDPEKCAFPDHPDACVDHRPPALRASDNAVETMLYRNWLRGLLGSADSPTAQKYGYALYSARTASWRELSTLRDPATRSVFLDEKSDQWLKIAEQIRAEDPEAYQYLQGTRGMDRIGAGFIALLSALLFAMFDLTASLLVLLGFLIIRWAVIAAPLIGTVGLLRPASGGFRRLAHSVVAAIFNIVVFGTGASIYLHAVDLIMTTNTLPGWLQVVLVLLCGVVGWMLLRPYRRITQLGGKDPLAAIAAGGLLHRRRARAAETVAVASRQDGGAVPAVAEDRPLRVELADPAPLTTAPAPASAPERATDPKVPLPRRPAEPERSPAVARQRAAVTVPDGQRPEEALAPGYALYRPGVAPPTVDDHRHQVRAEARSDAG